MNDFILYSLCIVFFYALYKLLKVLIKPSNGFPTLPLINTLPALFSNLPYDEFVSIYYEELQREGILKVFNYGVWSYNIRRADIINTVIMDPNNFPKIVTADISPGSLMGQLMGYSLPFSNGYKWRKQRAIIGPGFKHKFDEIRIQTLLIDKFDVLGMIDGGIIDLVPFFKELTLEALVTLIIGIDLKLNREEGQKFMLAFDNISNELFNVFYLLFAFLETPLNPFRTKIHEDMNFMKSYIFKIIEEKKKSLDSNTNNRDVLTALIESNLKEEDNLSELDLYQNLISLLIAGHDTTSFALSITLYFLSSNLHIQNKLRNELIEILGQDYTIVPNETQLKTLSYLDAVIKECLRLYPPSAIFPFRKNLNDLQVDNYTIPKNSILIVDTYNLHRCSEYFDKPNDFIPERFLNKEKLVKNSFLPFGNGSRMCIGNTFSLFEMKIFLCYILRKFKVTLADPDMKLKFKSSPLLTLESLNIKLELI